MSRTPDWVWKMHEAVSRYALPFTFGRAPRPGEVPDLHAASSVAVQFGAAQFLITARHVVEPALEAVRTPGVVCLVGLGEGVSLALTPDVVSLPQNEQDLATIRLSTTELQALEAAGSLVYRPAEWPPSDLMMKDPVLAVGFPGQWRRHVSWNELEFLSTTKLALVHQLREHEFACQLDPEYTDQYDANPTEEVSPDDLAGMSGGPAFLVRQETLVIPRLCGIVKEAWTLGDENRIIYFARLGSVNLDGTISA